MGQDRTILLVDDSSLFLEMAKSMLEVLPCRIVTAGGGEEGLEMARREKPALVLLDEVMPDLMGHEVLARMRDEPDLREIPVILVTGTDVTDVMRQYMSHGIVDTLFKPFEPEELLRKVGKALGLAERKKVSFLVRVQRKGEASFGKALDLSASGIRIETNQRLRQGEKVTLEFFVPGTSVQVVAKAEVARVLPHGVGAGYRRLGLRFLDISKQAKTSIERSLENR